MAGRCAQRTAAGESNAVNLPHALLRNKIAGPLDDFLLRAHGPDLGSLADQFSNRYTTAIRETYPGFAGDALAKIRHHRLLLDTLFDATIQLRQCYDRDF